MKPEEHERMQRCYTLIGRLWDHQRMAHVILDQVMEQGGPQVGTTHCLQRLIDAMRDTMHQMRDLAGMEE